MTEADGTKLGPKRRLATGAMAACLLVVPATALGGGTSLVDKDSSKGQFAVAVVTGDVVNPAKVLVKISAEPAHTLIDWSYTNRCIKNGQLHSYPGPGDHTVLTDPAPITETMKMPINDPESCDVAASGKLATKGGKLVRVKILAK